MSDRHRTYGSPPPGSGHRTYGALYDTFRGISPLVRRIFEHKPPSDCPWCYLPCGCRRDGMTR